MYWKIKLTRVETGAVWYSPYIFRGKKKAIAHAASWDRNFRSRRADKSLFPKIWKARLVTFKKKPKGVSEKVIDNKSKT